MKLDQRTIEILQPWFPYSAMRNVRIIQAGPVCWFVRNVLRQGAMTISPFIFYGRARFDASSPSSLALLAHELKHVEQYRRYGHVLFLIRYFSDMARQGFRYSRALPLESEAYGLQDQVRERLRRGLS
jgi:hypothetical protein